jgi:hypothetical protein
MEGVLHVRVLLVLVMLLVMMLVLLVLQRERAVMMPMESGGHGKARISAIATGGGGAFALWDACTCGLGFLNGNFNNWVESLGVMHTMTAAGRVVSMEGRVRLMLNKHSRQLIEGYGGNNLPILGQLK